MGSWHQTIIVGNVGKPPETRYTQEGKPVCNFSVAVNEHWKDKNTDEKREKTNWYRVSAWGGLAETCHTYVHQGMQIMVVGTVEARGYIDNAGEAAASLNLTALTVQFLGNKNGNGDGQPDDGFAPPPDDVNDIPF